MGSGFPGELIRLGFTFTPGLSWKDKKTVDTTHCYGLEEWILCGGREWRQDVLSPIIPMATITNQDWKIHLDEEGKSSDEWCLSSTTTVIGHPRYKLATGGF